MHAVVLSSRRATGVSRAAAREVADPHRSAHRPPLHAVDRAPRPARRLGCNTGGRRPFRCGRCGARRRTRVAGDCGVCRAGNDGRVRPQLDHSPLHRGLPVQLSRCPPRTPRCLFSDGAHDRRRAERRDRWVGVGSADLVVAVGDRCGGRRYGGSCARIVVDDVATTSCARRPTTYCEFRVPADRPDASHHHGVVDVHGHCGSRRSPSRSLPPPAWCLLRCTAASSIGPASS